MGRMKALDRSNISREHRLPMMHAYSASLDFASGYRGTGGRLGFDPYDFTLSCQRVLAYGEAASGAGVADCWTDIVGGTWLTCPSKHETLLIALGSAFVLLSRQFQTSYQATLAKIRHLLSTPMATPLLWLSTGGESTSNAAGQRPTHRPRSSSNPTGGIFRAESPQSVFGARPDSRSSATSRPHPLLRQSSMLALTTKPLGILDEQEEEASHAVHEAATRVRSIDTAETTPELAAQALPTDMGCSSNTVSADGPRWSQARRGRSSTASAGQRPDSGSDATSTADALTARRRAGTMVNEPFGQALQDRVSEIVQGDCDPQVVYSHATNGDDITAPRVLRAQIDGRAQTEICHADTGSLRADTAAPAPFFDSLGRAHQRGRVWPHGWEHMSRLREQQRREEELLGLVPLSECDEDLWLVYGGMLEEYHRLRGVVDGMAIPDGVRGRE
ncbi:unnamed protein product [Parajaminaea phylloscopi]